MLPTRDKPQDKRPIQTESEGLQINFPSKRRAQKSRGINTHMRQNRVQRKGHKERPRRSLHNTQGKNPSRGRMHQEDINTVKIYVPNIGAPKNIKKILKDFKKDVDSNKIIVGDFNTLLLKMERF